MILHRILDAIAGKKRDKVTGPAICIEEFKNLAQHAELFDFSQLPLDPAPNDPHKFLLPNLTKEENEFWDEGLIPLPAPVCWFEFKFQTVSGILIRKTETDIQVNQVDFGYGGLNEHECLIDGIWVTASKEQPKEKIGKSGINMYLDFTSLDKMFMNTLLSGLGPDHLATYYGGPYQLAKYLLLMLNSRTTEIVRKNTDEKLNRERKRRGATPIRSHFIVNIVPERFKVKERNADGSERASPRLHWRRSHRRTLYKGTPEERHIVIPRFLVGKRDLGEVTHEYVFNPKK